MTRNKQGVLLLIYEMEDHLIAENAILRLQVAMLIEGYKNTEKAQEELAFTQRELSQVKHSLAIRQAECASGRTALRLEQRAHATTREKLYQAESKLRYGRLSRGCEDYRASR